MRHFLLSFRKQCVLMCVQTELLVICWWQMSDYVTAWQNDTNANFVLLKPRWGARGRFAIRFCMDSPTIIKNLSKASGQFSWYILCGYASNIKHYQLTFIVCGHTMRASIKRMPVKQCLLIDSPLKIRHKSQVKLDSIRDVPYSKCVKRLLTRNSLVHICLLWYVLSATNLQNGVALNARGCLYVQH